MQPFARSFETAEMPPLPHPISTLDNHVSKRPRQPTRPSTNTVSLSGHGEDKPCDVVIVSLIIRSHLADILVSSVVSETRHFFSSSVINTT